MSDAVSDTVFPDDRRLEFNIEFDFGDAWYSSRATVDMDPVEDAVAIRNKETRGRSVRMFAAEIPFLADNKFDVLADGNDTASQPTI
ncbi:hypothetical protein BFX40_10100 [Mesorhizobium sp. SEMIA 3007]|nr:hypothetical protein BFX40_10100 [Mesorhizobium sp. SEMIA 3007]